ncbi:MAG TPA: hypothetical protein VEK39_05425 [Solirubrobacterales bacterium]|nr:hypothetical protein [Solirubrobacterales bacterium]
MIVVGVFFCVVFGLMTFAVVAKDGLDVLSVTAFAIVAMVLIGLLGAVRNPPGK